MALTLPHSIYTLEQFHNLLEYENGDVEIIGSSFTFELDEIADIPEGITSLKFNKCVFASITFSKISIPLEFDYCEFLGNIYFIDLSILEEDTQRLHEGMPLIFYQGIKFSGAKGISVYFSVKDAQKNLLAGGITFYDCNFILLSIDSVKEAQGLYIINLSPEKSKIERLNINYSTFKERIEIFDYPIRSLRCQSSSTKRFEIEGCTFDTPVVIYADMIDGLFLRDSTFNAGISVRPETENSKTLSIVGGSYKKGVRIQNKIVGFSNVSVSSGFFEEPIRMNGNNTSINRIRIIASHSLSGTIIIEDFNNIKELSLSGDNTKANIIISNSLIHEIGIRNFFNYGNLTLSNVSSNQGSFNIRNSNLGKTYLYNVNFRTFRTILIHNSILREITTSSVTWFSSAQLTIEDNKQIHGRREVFRQLKHAMESQGERIHALRFKRLEMIEYKIVLKAEKKEGLKNRGNRFTMWMNQSNDYGENFIKPALMLLEISILSYLLIFAFHNHYLCTTSSYLLPQTLISFAANTGQIFVLMNPVHSTKDVMNSILDVPISPIVYMIDFMQKIAASYLIFQTVSAFRKYVK